MRVQPAQPQNHAGANGQQQQQQQLWMNMRLLLVVQQRLQQQVPLRPMWREAAAV
jgi:hypothetical protein